MPLYLGASRRNATPIPGVMRPVPFACRAARRCTARHRACRGLAVRRRALRPAGRDRHAVAAVAAQQENPRAAGEQAGDRRVAGIQPAGIGAEGRQHDAPGIGDEAGPGDAAAARRHGGLGVEMAGDLGGLHRAARAPRGGRPACRPAIPRPPRRAGRRAGRGRGCRAPRPSRSRPAAGAAAPHPPARHAPGAGGIMEAVAERDQPRRPPAAQRQLQRPASPACRRAARSGRAWREMAALLQVQVADHQGRRAGQASSPAGSSISRSPRDMQRCRGHAPVTLFGALRMKRLWRGAGRGGAACRPRRRGPARPR